MNAALRIGVCALPFAGSVGLAWRAGNEHIAQGAPMFGPSVFGLLLWLWMMTVGSLGLVAGGIASTLLAMRLRLRPPAVVSANADRWLAFFGPAVFIAAAWAAWAFMWHVDRPTPTRYAPYGASYFWMVAWVGGAWSVLFGAAAYHVVVREVRVPIDLEQLREALKGPRRA